MSIFNNRAYSVNRHRPNTRNIAIHNHSNHALLPDPYQANIDRTNQSIRNSLSYLLQITSNTVSDNGKYLLRNTRHCINNRNNVIRNLNRKISEYKVHASQTCKPIHIDPLTLILPRRSSFKQNERMSYLCHSTDQITHKQPSFINLDIACKFNQTRRPIILIKKSKQSSSACKNKTLSKSDLQNGSAQKISENIADTYSNFIVVAGQHKNDGQRLALKNRCPSSSEFTCQANHNRSMNNPSMFPKIGDKCKRKVIFEKYNSQL